MLGVVPVRRKNSGTVLAFTVYNLILLTPFIVSFWVLTEKDHGSNRTCYGIPWEVSNFARWAYLGMAIYMVFSIPLNIRAIKRNRQLNTESGLTHWMQMFDTLFWLANWALWFYLITALANRAQCHYKQIVDLLWANVFISAAFALAGLIIALVGIAKFIIKVLKEISEEAKTKVGGTTVVATGTGVAAVEILDVRKSKVGVERVVDKGDAGIIISNTGIPVEKKIEKREEIINIRDGARDDPRTDVRTEVRREVREIRDERLELDDGPTNANNVRSQDVRVGHSQRNYRN
jgi:hypothetical protein